MQVRPLFTRQHHSPLVTGFTRVHHEPSFLMYAYVEILVCKNFGRGWLPFQIFNDKILRIL